MEFLTVLGLLATVGFIFGNNKNKENKEQKSNVTQDIPEMTPEEWDEFERECLETWPMMNPFFLRKDPKTGARMVRTTITDQDGSEKEVWKKIEL